MANSLPIQLRGPLEKVMIHQVRLRRYHGAFGEVVSSIVQLPAGTRRGWYVSIVSTLKG